MPAVSKSLTRTVGIKPQVAFDARKNAGPSNPPDYINGLRDPVSWGGVSGYPGLYQVRVILPELPVGAPTCVGGTNMTISVIGPYSFDGDRICMENATPVAVDPPAITGIVNSTTGQKCDLIANPNCTITASQLDTLELYGIRFNANGGNLLRLFFGTTGSESSYLYSGDGYYFWDGHGNTTRINAQIGCTISTGDFRMEVWPDSVHQPGNSPPRCLVWVAAVPRGGGKVGILGLDFHFSAAHVFAFVFLSAILVPVAGVVEMWETRVLGEFSKELWKGWKACFWLSTLSITPSFPQLKR